MNGEVEQSYMPSVYHHYDDIMYTVSSVALKSYDEHQATLSGQENLIGCL